MKKRYIILVIVMGFFTLILGACSFLNIFSIPDDGYSKTRDGREYIKDTERRWTRWTFAMDMHMDGEKRGKILSYKNWNNRFYLLLKTQYKKRNENYPKFIRYIIDKRRKLGLPEIRYEDPKIKAHVDEIYRNGWKYYDPNTKTYR